MTDQQRQIERMVRALQAQLDELVAFVEKTNHGGNRCDGCRHKILRVVAAKLGVQMQTLEILEVKVGGEDGG